MSLRSHHDIDQLAAEYGQDFTPDVEAGLRSLHSKIGLPGKATSGVARALPNRRGWLAAAATLLLAVAVGVYYFASGATSIMNDTAAPLAVELPDGTSVLLQQGSEITYDDSYNEQQRDVYLTGQGFFEVVSNTDKPFLVTSGKTTLRVTGTAFNLRVEGEVLEVEVSEGAVELAYDNVILPVSAMQCGLAKQGAAPTVSPSPNLNRHAWRTGKLVFENTPLSEVIATLNTNWDIQVDVPEGCDFAISATYPKINIQDILDGVAKQGGVRCQAEDDKMYRFVGNCVK